MEDNFIRYRRHSLGLTQDDIAVQLGIDRAAVAQWESGKTLPRSSRLIELSQILQCSVADIISNGKFNLP